MTINISTAHNIEMYDDMHLLSVDQPGWTEASSYSLVTRYQFLVPDFRWPAQEYGEGKALPYTLIR